MCIGTFRSVLRERLYCLLCRLKRMVWPLLHKVLWATVDIICIHIIIVVIYAAALITYIADWHIVHITLLLIREHKILLRILHLFICCCIWRRHFIQHLFCRTLTAACTWTLLLQLAICSGGNVSSSEISGAWCQNVSVIWIERFATILTIIQTHQHTKTRSLLMMECLYCIFSSQPIANIILTRSKLFLTMSKHTMICIRTGTGGNKILAHLGLETLCQNRFSILQRRGVYVVNVWHIVNFRLAIIMCNLIITLNVKLTIRSYILLIAVVRIHTLVWRCIYVIVLDRVIYNRLQCMRLLRKVIFNDLIFHCLYVALLNLVNTITVVYTHCLFQLLHL